MSRTYERAMGKDAHASAKIAQRWYNKLVRRTPGPFRGNEWKRLRPYYCCDLGHKHYEGDFMMKLGSGDWMWEEEYPDNLPDHLHRSKPKRSEKSQADKKMIDRRRRRRKKRQERDSYYE